MFYMRIIKREIYLSRIRKYYDIDLIKVLTGVRRCGKSIILNQIMDELKLNVAENHIIYINFEDFEFEEINTAKKLHEYIKPFIKDSKKYYLFFDEIQHVKDFEKVLASFKATLNCSIFVTGSNSTLLSGELATLLVGRTVEFQIMPFSYQETIQLFEINEKPLPENFIIDYIKWGGMPQRFVFEEEGEIKKYFRDKVWTLRVPRRVQELSKKVNEAKLILEQKNKKHPKVKEIADYIGCSEEEVLESLEASYGYQPVSLDATTNSDSEENISLMDKIADKKESFREIEYRDFIEKFVATLNELELKIFKGRFYLEKTQSALAQELSISQMTISRLERKIIEKLKKEYEKNI